MSASYTVSRVLCISLYKTGRGGQGAELNRAAALRSQGCAGTWWLGDRALVSSGMGLCR